jgi:hypothetical protein
MPLIIVGIIFITVSALVCVLLYPLLTSRSVVQERLEKLAVKGREKPSISLSAEKTPWSDFLARVGAVLPMAPKDQSKYTRMLVAAGFRKESLPIFLGSKIACTGAAGGLSLFLRPPQRRVDPGRNPPLRGGTRHLRLYSAELLAGTQGSEAQDRDIPYPSRRP